MKAATGELNLTVITLIAIGAIVAFFMTFLWPQIQNAISSQWANISSNAPGTGMIVSLIK